MLIPGQAPVREDGLYLATLAAVAGAPVAHTESRWEWTHLFGCHHIEPIEDEL
jgi:hypothetical protein